MLKRAVFVDTSAIYAIFAPRDFLKAISIEILKELLEEYQATLVTTNWVEYESLSKLRKHGIEFCKKFNEFITREVLIVKRVDEELEDNGLQIFWTFKDKSWGVVDCVSIAFMQANNLFYSFTQDEHFEQAGLFPLVKLDQSNNPIKSYSSLLFY